jgi:ArsR family transcriptional regulator
MDILPLYKCLGDWQRLRIVNVLGEGALCVCHLMEVLDLEQVRVSKQLQFMRERGVVEAERRAQWMIYSVNERMESIVRSHLAIIRRFGEGATVLREDLERREQVVWRLEAEGFLCLPGVSSECGEEKRS